MAKDTQIVSVMLALLMVMFISSAVQGDTLEKVDSIPPHRPIQVDGVHAYGPKKIEPGQVLPLHVSSTVPYELSIVRLGSDPDSMEKDITLLKTNGSPCVQAIHPGSYVHIAKGLKQADALTLECSIRAFDLKLRQGLITQIDSPGHSGFGLFLEDSRIVFQTGEHCLETPSWYLRPLQWHHVSATWDGSVKQIYIDGVLAVQAPYQEPLSNLTGPLKLAASSVDDKADLFFEGDLANCLIYERALTLEEVINHKNSLGLVEPTRSGLIGWWRFAEEKGSRVVDSSPQARDGRIINHGTWMIGGPSYNEKRSLRLDPTYRPSDDPTRGHSLRFCSDDLYDCRWSVTHTFTIPEDAPQGAYVARFQFETDGEPKVYDNTFVVRRPTQHTPAPMLVVCATNTWMAYNCYPFAANVKAGLINWRRQAVAPLSKSEYPGYCMYTDHRAGQPAFQVGINTPWPSASPYKTYYKETKVFSQWLRAERFLHVWLDQQGYAYDVFTDVDLDQQPELLKDYKTVCIVGHSEYWTEKAYKATEDYLAQGGTLTVLSGNSIYWRVSFDGEFRVMECRKYPEGLAASKNTQVGQIYHSQDGKRGALMRYCDMPAWKLIGLECLGWKSSNRDFQSYTVEEPEHFLFNTPHKINVARGDLMGQPNPDKAFLGAVGHEYDVRLPVLQAVEPSGDVPPQFMTLKEPQGIVSIARSYCKGREATDYSSYVGPVLENPTHIISEIILWNRDDGGRIFNIGSVAAPWGVYHDENMALLLKNALYHFGIAPTCEGDVKK